MTLKHFDANSLEGNWGQGGKITRHTVDATVSKFDLQTSYLPAFRTAVVEGGALGASFNKTVWRGMGEVIGLELRSLWLQGVGEDHDSNLPHIGLDCWSPNIGIVRDPRWAATSRRRRKTRRCAARSAPR